MASFGYPSFPDASSASLFAPLAPSPPPRPKASHALPSSATTDAEGETDADADAMAITPPTTALDPALMLPTPPASLPTSFGAAGRARERPLASDETSPLFTDGVDERGEGDGDDAAMRGATPPFELDLSEAARERDLPGLHERGDDGGAMNVEDDGPSAANLYPSPSSAPAGLNPFSAVQPIARPFRSRYAAASPPRLAEDLTDFDASFGPLGLTLPPQHKRNHSDVSPSSSPETGTPPATASAAPTAELDEDEVLPALRLLDTPPLSPSLAGLSSTLAPSLSAAPAPPYLTYDAQRARPAAPLLTSPLPPPAQDPSSAPGSGTSSSGFGVLRRRARSSTATSLLSTDTAAAAVTGAAGSDRAPTHERNASKRRRSGTRSLSLMWSSPSAPASMGESSSGSAGARARDPVSPVLSTTTAGAAGEQAFPSLSARTLGGCLPLAGSGSTGAERDEPATLRPAFGAAQPSAPNPGLGSGPPTLLRPRSPTARPFLSLASPTSSTSPSTAIAAQPAEADDTWSASLRRHARHSEELQQRGEGLLREAESAILRAEASVSRTRSLVQQYAPAPAPVREVESAAEARARETRAAVEVERIVQEQRAQQQREADERRRRRRSLLFGALSPPLPPAPAPATATVHGAPTSPTSPGSNGTTSSAARARQFLTQLRARRPRLSRNSTSVEPPSPPAHEVGGRRADYLGFGAGGEMDDVPSSAAAMEHARAFARAQEAEADDLPTSAWAMQHARARSAWNPHIAPLVPTPDTLGAAPPSSSYFAPAAPHAAPPPPPAAPTGPFSLTSSSASPPLLPPTSAFDESAERAAASRLNRRLLERRRVSESLALGRSPSPPPNPLLWGEVEPARPRGTESAGVEGARRMRYPTQGANERWRLGERPRSIGGATTSTTAATATATTSAVPPWRRASMSLFTPAETSGESVVRRRTPPPAPHERERDGQAQTYDADRHWWTPEESPSPQARRTGAVPSLADNSRAGDVAGTGSGERRERPFRLARGFDLAGDMGTTTPRRTGAGAGWRARPRLVFDEAEDETPAEEGRGRPAAGGGWAAPSTLPLMLPSGSDGRRPPMVFPHPAAAAGATVTAPAPGTTALEDWLLPGGGGGGHERERERRSELGDWRTDSEEGRRARSDSPFGQWGPLHLTDAEPPSRLPNFGFESYYNRSASSNLRRPLPWEDIDPRGAPSTHFNPFGDLPAPAPADTAAGPSSSSSFPSSRFASPPTAARARSTLAEALAHFDGRPAPSSSSASTDALLRRRHTAGAGALANALDHTGPSSPGAARDPRIETVADRLAQHRQGRLERIASLRRERMIMRSLLSGSGSGTDSANASRGGATSPAALADAALAQGPTAARGLETWTNSLGEWVNRRDAQTGTGTSGGTAGGGAGAASPPQSPGTSSRRRFGQFFRTLGGGGGGGRFVTIFDDDWGFFGRAGDSAALDPRNYLDDETFDDSYEALLRLSERLGDVKPRGASGDKLASLRKFSYEAWPAGALKADERTEESKGKGKEKEKLAEKGVEKETRCPICLCDYDDDDDCMLGDCGHGAHEECLTAWLGKNPGCPVCRRDHTT
ncbi:hypothetical protein JCM10207_000857 [Rhodosporidiobolus poonsookiae]